MSDWRQIQARIRKARTSADPAGQLAGLYERTRDAMVAFELARHQEQAGQNEEAARWYTAAAERFRRAVWKEKAAAALARLGAPVPPPAAPAGPLHELSDAPVEFIQPLVDVGQGQLTFSAPPPPAEESSLSSGQAHGRKRRRRGRRGGRGRRRGGEPRNVSVAELPSDVAAEATVPRFRGAAGGASPRREIPAADRTAEEFHGVAPEPTAERPAALVRGRAGDPGLSSRTAQLESQLRRLLTCPPARFDEAERGPAGPGVFVVSDSDQITYYYVEACKTLRIAMANILRPSRGTPRAAESLKSRFAEDLGISEAKVAKYVTDHCVFRWIQLDDGASHLAHFAIAVLRPALND